MHEYGVLSNIFYVYYGATINIWTFFYILDILQENIDQFYCKIFYREDKEKKGVIITITY